MMQVLEQTRKFLGIVEEESNAVICETPFEVFVIVWWKVESEGCGTEKAVEFGGVN